MNALLEVRDLRITLGSLAAVRGVSFEVQRGETLAIVGESGAGKSLTVRAALGLLPPDAVAQGNIRFDGEALEGRDRSRLWGRRMAFVPQDALSVLSPVHTVGEQLALAARSVQGLDRKAAWAVAVEALDRVGIPDPSRRAKAYPHEFSGGMRQRAVIAMATLNEPELVVADEPTTALDPLRQRQILDLLGEVRNTGAALVLVTHDIAAVAAYADRMVVMRDGEVLESGRVQSVLRDPGSAYTAALIAAVRPASGRRQPATVVQP